MRAALFAILLIVCGSALSAGAWQRAAGTGFGAASIRLGWPQDIATWTSHAPTSQYRTLYLEYGLSDRLSAGFDLGRAVSGADKTIVFVQFPVRQQDGGVRIAGQLGFGSVGGQSVLRPGLSLGWGLDQGWLALDGAVEYGLDFGTADWKLDVTWGRNLGRDRKLMVQVQMGETDQDPPFVRLAPSVVVPLTARLQVEAGVNIGVVNDSAMGVMMGLWADF